MRTLSHLFRNNKDWAEQIRLQDAGFFERLARQQSPEYLWIGCSDSRVPANEIVGLLPGELFVHRNIANVVAPADLNCLSVLQFAVEVLKVRHVIICGHYGCAGVQAALRGDRLGLVDNWLRQVQEVREKHRDRLETLADPNQQILRLCELNVIEQVAAASRTTIVRDAWRQQQALSVHGWIYALDDGRLRDLETTMTNAGETGAVYERALARFDERSGPLPPP